VFCVALLNTLRISFYFLFSSSDLLIKLPAYIQVMNLKNKVVVITGASSGIGLACAREFARRHCHIVIAARNTDNLLSLENELKSAGVKVLSVPTDVSSEDDCLRLIDQTIKTFGRLDVLINNAGLSMRALFAEADLAVIKRLMDVNFWGTVYCTKYALPWLLEAKAVWQGFLLLRVYMGCLHEQVIVHLSLPCTVFLKHCGLKT
jgi:NAD(P)-dependent dehydrogenase (short-subunit alcohol dehydrogenase family)